MEGTSSRATSKNRAGGPGPDSPGVEARTSPESTPAVGPPAPEPPPDEAVRPSAHYARHLQDTAAALFMGATMAGFLQEIDAVAFRIYRDNLLRAAGDPSDPVAVMLLEQVALAHLNIGRLHFKSAAATSLEGARAYGSMAIALTGEFRRTALAFQAYRAAAGGTAGSGAAARAVTASPGQVADDGELVSKPEAVDDGTIRFEEPAPGGGGEEERPEAEGPDAGRARTVARGRAG